MFSWCDLRWNECRAAVQLVESRVLSVNYYPTSSNQSPTVHRCECGASDEPAPHSSHQTLRCCWYFVSLITRDHFQSEMFGVYMLHHGGCCYDVSTSFDPIHVMTWFSSASSSMMLPVLVCPNIWAHFEAKDASVCVCVCVCVLVLAPQWGPVWGPVKWGHFGWSSLCCQAFWGLRLGFRVRV